jgi:N-acetylglucosamine kinase-like BadF-type ATPase
MGDEGSGFAIGQAALKASVACFEGRGQETKLLSNICSFFNIESFSFLRTYLYSITDYQKTISSLAPVVLETAQSGDLIAQEIIIAVGNDLAKLALDVMNRLDFEDFHIPVVMTGGITQFGEFIFESFEKTIRENSKRPVTLLAPKYSPGVGALIMALLDDGINIDHDFIENFERG